MNREDLEAAALLEQLCFSVPWSLASLEQGLSNELDHYLVAEVHGNVAGYASLRIVAGEGEIQRIAVHPKMQGQGLGRKLMEAMEEYARSQGAGAMTLEVRAGSRKAINLYESCGFVKEGCRRAYYREPEEDALIMWHRGI